MARAPSGGGFVVTWEVHDEAVQRGLQQQRRQIKNDIKQVALKAAWTKVVPAAKVLAPSFYSRNVIARSTRRGAYLTTAGSRSIRNAAGLMEFGGTRRDVIRPKKAGGALKFGGRFVAYVDTPRTYPPRFYLTRAVRSRASAFAEQVDDEITRIMRSRIEFARTF